MTQVKEKTTAGGQPMSEYWKEAWQKAQNRELEAQRVIRDLTLQNHALAVERNAYKAERYRWRKEAKTLRQKLAEIETAIRCLMDGTELDGESGPSRALRGYVWNAEDTEAMREMEGIDE